MRQAAEDVSAHSALKDPERQEKFSRTLMRAANVAEKNFRKKDQQRLAEAVVLFLDYEGELEVGDDVLLATMNRLRELPVAASAVKFCSNLFREANAVARKRRMDPQRIFQKTARHGPRICDKVLTGELARGPKWAEEAAKSSQPKGQHYQLGRLQEVNALQTAWRVSFANVCRDECQELVKEMQRESQEIFKDVGRNFQLPSYEEVCAKRVVQKVEAEILGCCAESCGWNGRACMLWPFLNSTEKGQWEAECCTEFNILAGSSRAIMCDATLTRKENNKVIRDSQPNSKEEREMIGQDPVGRGTSFLQEEDTNGLTPSSENKPIPRHEGKCPPPLDLGEVHAKWKKEWKTIELPLAKSKKFKHPGCRGKEATPLIEKCPAFLPQGVDGGYVCYRECLKSVSWSENDPDLKTLDAESTGNTGLLYVHETIYKK